MKNPVLSGQAGMCLALWEQDGGEDQQQKLLEPCQQEPEVVADGAEQHVDGVSPGAL